MFAKDVRPVHRVLLLSIIFPSIWLDDVANHVLQFLLRVSFVLDVL
jgi:hypothetical protein